MPSLDRHSGVSKMCLYAQIKLVCTEANSFKGYCEVPMSFFLIGFDFNTPFLINIDVMIEVNDRFQVGVAVKVAVKLVVNLIFRMRFNSIKF